MQEQRDMQEGFFTTRAGWVFLGFLAITSYFLVTEHSAHLALAIPYFPYLLFLACPLMHVFMHRGHNNQHRHNETRHQAIGDSGR